MDLERFFADEFDEHDAVVRATRDAIRAPFVELVAAAAACIRGGGKIMLFGNGGSAADSQHLATELTIRYKTDRAPIAAIALTTDTSALTACGNDLGFDNIFARQVEALGRPGDVCIGISTSGNSENVIRALALGRGIGCVPAGFGGRDGGRMKDVAAPFLVVPSETTARIQEMHIMLGQMLCGALEGELGLA